MINEIRQLAIFVKVVDLSSFSSAARALGLSTSVVSHHITELESRLGVALLYRSTRKMSLTAEGKKVLKHARDMVESAEKSIDAITRDSAVPSGELSISIPSVLIRSPLQRALAEFCKSYPGIRLSINVTDQVVDLVSGPFDLALRIGRLKDSTLKSAKVFSISRLLVASKKLQSIKSIDQLRSAPWIHLSQLPPYRILTGPGNKRQKISYSASLSVDSVDAAFMFCLSGCGIFTAPDFLAEHELSTGRLLHLLPEWSPDSLPVYMLWHGNSSKNSLVSLLKSSLQR